ncbi:histidine kinase [Bacteroides sp. 519]|uniref:histidine kinase n=1 Tax=Bacteroides sp. 519 TaxID=2302937 RepID=UPI0013D1F574|nr:histidine kinase [Bacteroides sp. 519]NDV57865.1 hypothetical protein [Bacteroides sp. 519]
MNVSKYALLFCAMIFMFTSCKRFVYTDVNNQQDSLFNKLKKELNIDPAATKQELITHLNHCTDSFYYYKLWSLYSNGSWMENNIDSAFIINKQVLSFCDRQKSSNQIEELRAKALNDRGIYSYFVGMNDSAIVCYQKAAECLTKIGHKQQIPDICINIADCYILTGELPLAIDYYIKGLLTADSLGLLDMKFAFHSGLAKVYTDLKNFAKAEAYFSEIEDDFDNRPINERNFYAASRGNYYYSKKEYASALPWFKKSKEIANQFGYASAIRVSDINLGEIYLLLNQPDSARYYLDKAKENIGGPGFSDMDYYLDGLYASLNLLNGNLSGAEQLLLKDYSSVPIAPIYIYYNNKRLEELYRKRKDYPKAYKYRELADEFNDSLRNITLQNNIAEMNLRHERDTMLLNRDIRIITGEQSVLKLKNQNYLILLAAVFICVVFIVIAFYWRSRKKQEYNKQLSQLTALRAKNIKNRMTPHYVKNVITAILPSLRNTAEYETIDLLVKSLRNELLMSDKIFTSLGTELEIVRNYLDLTCSIATTFPQIEWKIDGAIDTNMNVPSMIIQIPVENAIKSAFPLPNQNDRIEISARIHSNWIKIAIADNGVGFQVKNINTSDNGTKKGLQILKQTIELLNSHNVERIEFDVRNLNVMDSPKPGTLVEISIPISYKYEL